MKRQLLLATLLALSSSVSPAYSAAREALIDKP